jgi:hypothetical protein
MWWNLRGDACLPREHAAREFCTTVWPGSDAYFVAGGGYRCVCAPPLLWNAEATACRAPNTFGAEDCAKEWPTTLPVLSPSGTEFECRCPGGRRWDETSRSCVAGAPVVSVSRGFANEGDAPGSPAPQAPAYVAPPSGAALPSNALPSDAIPPSPPPTATAPGASVPGAAPSVGGARPGANAAACDALLAEIRGRAAAGQTGQVDALGMRAAIAGCDPAAISEATRTKPAPR